MKGLGRLIRRLILSKRLDPRREHLIPCRFIFSSSTTTSYLENSALSSRFTFFNSSSLPKWTHFGGFSLIHLFGSTESSGLLFNCSIVFFFGGFLDMSVRFTKILKTLRFILLLSLIFVAAKYRITVFWIWIGMKWGIIFKIWNLIYLLFLSFFFSITKLILSVIGVASCAFPLLFLSLWACF